MRFSSIDSGKSMNNDNSKAAERKVEIFIGTGVLGVGALFIILFIYFLVVAIQNGKFFSLGVLALELVLGFIGYSLGIWGARLISGRGKQGSEYLLSNPSLLLWGTFLGVAGVIEIIFAISNEGLYLLLSGVVCVAMGLGSYNLVKRRRSGRG